MIGIMADSHGQPETITAALGMLTNIDCRPIYHLGDVCDSTHPETVEACLGSLRDSRVIIIKGNNDQAIVANHIGQARPPVSPEILRYLRNLPLVKYHLNAIFAHSLPFVRELGVSQHDRQHGGPRGPPIFLRNFLIVLFSGGTVILRKSSGCRDTSLQAGPLLPEKNLN